MARMRSDTDRGMMLRKMLDDMYGDAGNETGVPPVPPAGETRPQDEEQVARTKGPTSDPQTDSDYEAIYGAEDDEDLPPFQEERPPTRGAPQADPRMNQADGEEMVPVPKKMVQSVMQAMMRSASRNSIGKSRGADGNGYQQMAQNDGADPAMMRKMQFMSGAGETTSNPEDWQNDRYYMGSRQGAQSEGVIGSRNNDNLKKKRPQ